MPRGMGDGPGDCNSLDPLDSLMSSTSNRAPCCDLYTSLCTCPYTHALPVGTRMHMSPPVGIADVSIDRLRAHGTHPTAVGRRPIEAPHATHCLVASRYLAIGSQVGPIRNDVDVVGRRSCAADEDTGVRRPTPIGGQPVVIIMIIIIIIIINNNYGLLAPNP